MRAIYLVHYLYQGLRVARTWQAGFFCVALRKEYAKAATAVSVCDAAEARMTNTDDTVSW